MVRIVDTLISLGWKIREAKDRVKWRLQRVFRGYADIDVWDFDHRLMELVARHVKVLRKTCHGYPSTVKEQEWDQILDDIVFAAEMYTSDVGDVCIIETEEDYERCREIHEKVYTGENDPKWPSREDWQRARRGIELFKQHMFNLWD